MNFCAPEINLRIYKYNFGHFWHIQMFPFRPICKVLSNSLWRLQVKSNFCWVVYEWKALKYCCCIALYQDCKWDFSFGARAELILVRCDGLLLTFSEKLTVTLYSTKVQVCIICFFSCNLPNKHCVCKSVKKSHSWILDQISKLTKIRKSNALK